MRNSVKKIVKEKSFWCIMIGIALIKMLYWRCWQSGYQMIDSATYIGYDFEAFMRLELPGRTPVYPAILAILRMIFGEDRYLHILTIVQILISYLSCIYLYKSCKMVCKNEILACALTFLYGTSTGINGWDYCVLTESLAISSTVFFIYLLFQYVVNEDKKYSYVSNVLLLFMIFLRPTFLLFLIIEILFFVFCILLKKNDAVKSFISGLVISGVVLIYSCCFYQVHGLFTIADQMPRQLLYVCINEGYYVNSEDIAFVQTIKKAQSNNENLWAMVFEVQEEYDPAEIQKFVKECIKKNWKQYLVDEFEVACYVLESDFEAYQKAKVGEAVYKNHIAKIVDKTVNVIRPVHGMIVAAVLLVLFILQWTQKRICWVYLGCAGFLVSIFLSTIIATNGEYIRTMIHIVPFIYVGIATVCGHFMKNGEECLVSSLEK